MPGVISVGNIFRIYTEDKNKRDIVRLTGQEFESFTLQPTLGYYRGKPEKSIVIEIVGAREPAIRKLARRIKQMNGQKSILIMKIRGDAKTTRSIARRRNASNGGS
jgi:hypothetical protein